MNSTRAPRRPVLRYHGGKWMLATWIIAHFPPHRIYVEPFAGAASVLLRKPRSLGEVYNDLDGDVVRLFRLLRDPDQSAALARALHLTPFAREEYGAARAVDLSAIADEVEAARLFVTRSFMGQGTEATIGTVTGFRAKSWASHRAAPQDWMNYPDNLAAVTERLRGVVIENLPADQVMRRHDAPDALHYLDPPYVHSSRSRVRGYRCEMTDAEHETVAAVAHEMTGAVVISGYRCALYDRLYEDWKRVEREAAADGGGARVEVLWMNRSPKQGSLPA